MDDIYGIIPSSYDSCNLFYSMQELLALGEQIGSVGSGLSDDFILEHLKIRVFALFKFSSEPEDASSSDQETNSCVICQVFCELQYDFI